jgi:DNA-directed RNA polymerase specialized sigma24 family protein
MATALHTSVTDLRRRQQAISTLSNLRHHQSLVVGEPDADLLDTVQVAADVDVEADATTHDRNAQITRAIMGAVNNPASTGRRSNDPLALAAVYLTFWEGLGRSDVARELEVLPKTVAASLSRVLEQVQSADLL